VHDGIHLEQAGIPAVTICTDIFMATSRAMASLWGAPDYPILFTPHPISNLTRTELRARATAMLDEIVRIVTGGYMAPPR
jgi:hypothetical protein